MTTCTKTPRSAKDRKKGSGRPGHEAPHDVPDDVPILADFLREAGDRPEKVEKPSLGRRDAFTRYMHDIWGVADLLERGEEFAMATKIQQCLAGAVKALKEVLPAAEGLPTCPPSKRSAKTSTETQDPVTLSIRFNPEGLRGAELDAHIDKSSRTYAGLSMIEWHDPLVYRVAVRFIYANLRLVIRPARRYARRMPLEDLIQEGNEGLVIAMLRYDPARGYRFSTYACWWIRLFISRAVAEQGRTIRLPVHMTDFAQTVSRFQRKLLGDLKRLPTQEEIAEAVGCTTDKLRLLRESMDEPRSLNVLVHNRTKDVGYSWTRTYGSKIAAETPDVSDWATLVPEKGRQILHAAIDELPPLMKDILRLRFGFDDEEELTLKEIGAKHNLSRERIRQLQNRALERLRKRLPPDFAVAI